MCDALAGTPHSRQFADVGKDLPFSAEVADTVEGFLSK